MTKDWNSKRMHQTIKVNNLTNNTIAKDLLRMLHEAIMGKNYEMCSDAP